VTLWWSSSPEPSSSSSPASSSDTPRDQTYKACYVPGTSGLPSLDNIPSVADLTASFAARKEERLKQEVEKKESERRVSAPPGCLLQARRGAVPGPVLIRTRFLLRLVVSTCPGDWASKRSRWAAALLSIVWSIFLKVPALN